MIRQRTILKPVSMVGIGLHSGAKVEVSFRPAPSDTGIVYTRTDLDPAVTMKCSAENVRDTQLCTALVSESGARISTVEHLTAALSALGIDNLFVDVNAPSEVSIVFSLSDILYNLNPLILTASSPASILSFLI